MKITTTKRLLTVLILFAVIISIFLAGTYLASPEDYTGEQIGAWKIADSSTAGALQPRPVNAGKAGKTGIAAPELLGFIEKQLTNRDGGIMTNYLQEKISQLKYTDVLCESQGLVMEYAAKTRNKVLFDKSFNYVNNKMRKDPLVAWVVNEKGPIRINSSVDDLRIYRALSEADDVWGGYSGILDNYGKALRRYNTQNHKLVNGYDFKLRKKSNELKLGFADFEALKLLAGRSKLWEQVFMNGLDIVEKGYIGDKFPLYYASYNYSSKSYSHEDINMAEGMVTLLHLSKIKKLKPETLKWLKNAVYGQGVFARYRTDGTVAPGCRFESTAVYGLVSMTALYAGDRQLADKALEKMEKMRISDPGKKINGAFGNTDGTGIFSFDQCIGLLTYGVLEESEAK